MKVDVSIAADINIVTAVDTNILGLGQSVMKQTIWVIMYKFAVSLKNS